MTEIKAMIAGTNERVGTNEVKLARGSMPDTDQTVVETVENSRSSYRNGAAENINHASLDTGVPALIANFSSLITDRQNAATTNDTVVSAQRITNNSEAEVTSLLKDVKSLLGENKNSRNTFSGAVNCTEEGIQGERALASTHLRDSRVTLASDRSSVNALASTHTTATEGLTYEALDGLSQGRKAQTQGKVVQVDDQRNNNAGIENFLNNDSLKNDVDLVSLAAKRLAELGLHETQKSYPIQGKSGYAGKSKRSGAVSKATDKVIKELDWPHYHITRGVDLLPSSYDELSLDDFCLGYIRMLRDADSNFNLHIMMEILEDLLEDTDDFSWKNVKGYYKSLALAIEQGKLKWEDTAAIQKRRFTQCRV